jgi:anti-sigma regulatory factor (Ser/Thr protein kinase)
MVSPRTYTYIQAIVKRGEAARSVERMKKAAFESATFDVKYAKELSEAWTIVEAAAERGAIRVFARDHPVFKNPAIQSYFVTRGFGWSDTSEGGSLEWWAREPEMK